MRGYDNVHTFHSRKRTAVCTAEFVIVPASMITTMDGNPASSPQLTLHIQPGFQMPRRERCFSGTPFAIKVQRVLRYKGLPFDVHEVPWAERDDFLGSVGEAKKLPILEYDGKFIEDSTSIAHFVDARHPLPSLLPVTPLLRARCHFLEEWADEVMYWYGIFETRRIGPFAEQMRAYYPDLDSDRLTPVVAMAGKSVDRRLEIQGIGRYPVAKMQGDVCRGLDGLEAFVSGGKFVAGPNLSLADCALFGQFHRRLAGTNPWLESQVAKRPVLRNWLDRVDRTTGTPYESESGM